MIVQERSRTAAGGWRSGKLRLWLPARNDLALAVIGATTMILAAPPANRWPLGLAVWVPLAVAAGSGDVRRAGLVGWTQGILAQGGVLAGLPAALRQGGGASLTQSWGQAAGLVGKEGARFGVIGVVSARATRNGWPLVLAFPVALGAVEWLYPMFFPWSTSLFFHGAPVLLQGAELGGALVLSLWAGFLAASLATAWLERARQSAVARYGIVLPAMTLAAVATAGAVRMRDIDERAAAAPGLRVGVVQGNVTEVQVDAQDPTFLYRTASLELLSREKVDLLVWPETAVSLPVQQDRLQKFLVENIFRRSRPPVDRAARIDVPLLTGMVLERDPSESAAHVRMLNPDGTWQRQETRRFNSAVASSPDGSARSVYDKRELVAFGEYVPWEHWFPWLRDALPSAGTFSPGTSSAPLPLGDRRILTLICYEDIMAERVRAAADEGDPDLLVNLTSDAWFGRSRVPSLHAAIAKLRAIEHRRFLVRVTNTGVTAAFDPSGRTVAALPPNRLASTVVEVRWMRARTIYERLGTLPAWLVLAVAVLLGLRKRADVE